MKIPLGNLMRKMCAAQSMKSHKGLGQKKRQILFTGNARKEGGRTLIKNTVAGNDGKLKLHAQPTTLAPSQHNSHQPPLPPLLPNSLSHACLCITSSPPTTTPDYFETTNM
jgi:hypothetical protein